MATDFDFVRPPSFPELRQLVQLDTARPQTPSTPVVREKPFIRKYMTRPQVPVKPRQLIQDFGPAPAFSRQEPFVRPQVITAQPQPAYQPWPTKQLPVTAPIQAPQSSSFAPAFESPKKKSWFSIRTVLGVFLSFIGILLIMTGLFTPLLQQPHIVVGLYIPIALIFKLKSQTSFTLALLLLLAIPILIIIGQQPLAETYAIFSFYFLVVGVLMATFELRSSPRKMRLNGNG